MSDTRKYFASLGADEIGDELSSKVDNWEEFVNTSGIFERMRRSHEAYYGFNGSEHLSSQISHGGIQGELNLVKVNQLRNILQHMLVMTTSQRPAMEARAINTDYKSIAQTVLANGILDYYMREKRLEKHLKTAAEIALIFGEGYVRLEWDSSKGEEYMFDDEEQEMLYTGDIKYSALTPFDVIKDPYRPNSEDQDWIIVIHYKNKFDLAAKYPEFEDKLMDIETISEDMARRFSLSNVPGESNLIPVYEFYHKRSDSVVDGRHTVFVNDEIVLHDGPLPYNEIPVYRISPGDWIGTNYGYSAAFDLLGIQEAIDILYSTVVTNQSTFGVQNIMVPKGHGMEVSQIAGGLNLLEYDSQLGAPQSLQLTDTPAEVFKFIEMLEGTMETLSGVNSVARGDPQNSLRSGSALALVQSMALQFNSGLQQAYTQLAEDVATATILTLRDFAAIPRVASIVGKDNRAYLKTFSGQDLDQVNRVIVDLGNPLARTTAGKMEIASELLQQGLIKNPQEYFMVLKTGQLDPLYDEEFTEMMNMQRENERLRDGKTVKAVLTDNHVQHIRKHKAVLDSPESRENPEIVEQALAHIQEHINLLSNPDPNVIKVLEILEQPAMGAQPANPAQPPAPGGDKMNIQGVEDVLGGAEPTNAAEMAGVSLPSAPDNPLTGESFDPNQAPPTTMG